MQLWLLKLNPGSLTQNLTDYEKALISAILAFSAIGESGALRSGVWFRANNLMIMMTQHNFCLLFD